jgi:hypothetical protein
LKYRVALLAALRLGVEPNGQITPACGCRPIGSVGLSLVEAPVEGSDAAQRARDAHLVARVNALGAIEVAGVVGGGVKESRDLVHPALGHARRSPGRCRPAEAAKARRQRGAERSRLITRACLTLAESCPPGVVRFFPHAAAARPVEVLRRLQRKSRSGVISTSAKRQIGQSAALASAS